MPLSQAIEILEGYLYGDLPDEDEDEPAAIRLSIEALKYVGRNRLGDVINPDALLPGETEE